MSFSRCGVSFVALLCIFGLLACGDEVKFGEVRDQVLSPSCSLSGVCHKGANPAGGLSLEAETAFQALVKQASTEVPAKVRVSPGEPDNSFIMDKLLDRNLPVAPAGEEWTSMPPGIPLEAARIELVRGWIAAGAKND